MSFSIYHSLGIPLSVANSTQRSHLLCLPSPNEQVVWRQPLAHIQNEFQTHISGSTVILFNSLATRFLIFWILKQHPLSKQRLLISAQRLQGPYGKADPPFHFPHRITAVGFGCVENMQFTLCTRKNFT